MSDSSSKPFLIYPKLVKMVPHHTDNMTKSGVWLLTTFLAKKKKRGSTVLFLPDKSAILAQLDRVTRVPR